MGWKFRKAFKVAPGIRVHLRGKSASVRIGPRNAGISIAPEGVSVGASIPGTGLSFSAPIGKSSDKGEAALMAGNGTVSERPSGRAPQRKSMVAAYGLWIFTGILGGHRLYLGRPLTASAMATLTIAGVILAPAAPAGFLLLAVLLWAIVDLALIPRLIRRTRVTIDSVTEKASSQSAASPLAMEFSQPTLAIPKTMTARDQTISTCAYSFDHTGVKAGGAAQAGRLIIEYADADGVITTREIEIRSVELSSEALYVNAFCNLRGAERTFRVDRILSARKSATGPKIRDVEAYIVDFLPEHQLPDPRHDALMNRVAPTLSVLVWIAYADRQISVEELEILLSFIVERSGEASGDAWNRAKASLWIEDARPTFASASGALAKINRSGKVFTLVEKYASLVAEAGGVASENRRRQLFGSR